MMDEHLNQACILLRIGNFYFGLIMLQLTLTISYLITFHMEMIEFASWI